MAFSPTSSAPDSTPDKKNLMKGAVLLEAAIVVPLYLFLIAAVLYFGQVLNQLTWLAQTAYQAAYLAAETDPGSRDEKVRDISNLLLPLQNATLRNSPLKSLGMTTSTDSLNKLVSVKVNGELSFDTITAFLPFLHFSAIPVGFETTAPLLVSNELSNIDGNFQNPPPQQCCPGGSGGLSPGSCVTCSSPTNCHPTVVCNP